MTRIARRVLAAVLCLAFVLPGVAHAIVISVSASPATAEPGDSIFASISVDDGSGLVGIDFGLGYDASALEIVDVTAGAGLALEWLLEPADLDVAADGWRYEDFLGFNAVTAVDDGAGSLGVSGFAFDPVLAPGPLTVLEVELRVLAGAPAGPTLLTLGGPSAAAGPSALIADLVLDPFALNPDQETPVLGAPATVDVDRGTPTVVSAPASIALVLIGLVPVCLRGRRGVTK